MDIFSEPFDAIIVSGGSIDDRFVFETIEHVKDINGAASCLLIAADRGMDFFLRNNIDPDILIGDFDSMSSEGATLVLSGEKHSSEVIRLKPEKDDTDTQSALLTAEAHGAKRILLLGCTGTRLDHVISNLGLLITAKERGLTAVLADPHNTICLASDGMTLEKSRYGDYYISFFAAGSDVTGLTLTGFQYPLTDFTLKPSCAGLTVSNRIVEPWARVDFDSGELFLFITGD